MDFLPAAGAAGIFTMLATLFGLSMNAILKTGERADTRSDAEIARLHKEREIESAKQEAVVEAKDEEIAYWRDKYLSLLQGKNS